MTLNKLRIKLQEIRALGFVRTLRVHDTGIGKTLETLLGLKENNFRTPDFGKIELKAKRIESGSMLTIATKSPIPKGINRILFEKCKYKDKEGHYNLHSTVCGSRKNPQGFRVIFDGYKLLLKNSHRVEAYWPFDIFD